MNWLDIVFICLVIAGCIQGYSKGFIRQSVSLLALIGGIYFCSELSVYVRVLVLQPTGLSEETVTVLSTILAFLGIAGIILVTGKVVHKLIDIPPLNLLNRLIGAGLGLVTVIIISSLIFNILETFENYFHFISLETKVKSKFYLCIKDLVPAIYSTNIFIWKG